MGARVEIDCIYNRHRHKSSLPSWERGLKYADNMSLQCKDVVAPLVGARVEIPRNLMHASHHWVAPLVGARVEIAISEVRVHNGTVAPLVGARVEIEKVKKDLWYTRSLPSWERGLK